MAESPFPFLRATFYRWVQLWPQMCPELAIAPAVLGVGDLHVENFGTWRDSEGRLIWGVNDFDEVATMPYANDLVRLAVSAGLAISESQLSSSLASACDAILAGYQEHIEKGGATFVLAEQHPWLREWALMELRDPVTFWQKFDPLPALTNVPSVVMAALKKALPESHLPFRVIHRQSGLGSLGRRRFTAIADWRGGKIAREAKELAPSAWHWEKRKAGAAKIVYQIAIDRAVRVPDPFAAIKGNWLLRRLAPDCSRIELGTLPKARNELKLLTAMGKETANVHLGTKGVAGDILRDLKRRPAKWLHKAAQKMSDATLADWRAWKKTYGK